MKNIILLGVLTAFLGLVACTDIVSATRDTPIEPDPQKTPIGTDLNDFQMETAIGVNINKASSELDASHINVNAYNGVVLLTGEVPHSTARTLAGETARNYLGVRLVHNELLIEGKSSFLSRTNDNWLATKLRTKLIAEKNVRSTTIKIVAEAGTVYMMGLVDRQSADVAAIIASGTGGVKRVVKLFEYQD